MKGSTPKARATNLHKELKRLYDDFGPSENVTDMLTDLRHLCDLKGWNFADLDRQAYNHYSEERTYNHIAGADSGKKPVKKTIFEMLHEQYVHDKNLPNYGE